MFLGTSTASANPYMCYRAIKAIGESAFSIAKNELTTFKNDCKENIECKQGCREDRKAWKKSIKSWEKSCKSKCKSAYKENKKGTKGKAKKELKNQKKTCTQSCKSIAKKDRSLMKSIDLNKCGKFCKPKLSTECVTARRALAIKIAKEAGTKIPKAVGACSTP
jgi:hypothetical protein